MKPRCQSIAQLTALSGRMTACLLGALLVTAPISGIAQGRGGDHGGGGQHSSPPPPRPSAPQGGIVHARREVARTREPQATPRYVPPPSIRNIPQPTFRPNNPPQTGNDGFRPGNPTRPNNNDNSGFRQGNTTRPGNPTRPGYDIGQDSILRRTPVATSARRPDRPAPQAVAQREFTKTAQGRHYDNGIQLRHGQPVHEEWQRRYFKQGRYHYPFYAGSYNSASVFISPFGFYFGVCAPFIARDHCYVAPPPAIFIDIPIYSGDTCQGYQPINQADNYLDLDDLKDREPGLANAVDELREAFGRGDIDALVSLTEPNQRIAIFERGRYQYSLDADDFLDMSRDAFQSTQTIAFDITAIHERAAGVFVVSGQHVYADPSGHSRAVYVSYVLENINDTWTLTQVGTAPDRIQGW